MIFLCKKSYFFAVAFLLFSTTSVAYAQTSFVGDANGDGVVDRSDLEIFLTNYRRTGVNTVNEGDFNGDSKVDTIDYSIWLHSKGVKNSDKSNTETIIPKATNTSTPYSSPTPTPIITPDPIYFVTPKTTITPVAVSSPSVSNSARIEPTDDTFVRSGRYSKRNYSKRRSLDVDGMSTKLSYLKFDVASIVTKPVSKATLNIKIENSSKHSQNISLTQNNWDESSVTYNNSPLATEFVTTFQAKKRNRWVRIDITDQINNNSSGFVSLMIDSVGRDGLSIYSKESRNKPFILVE